MAKKILSLVLIFITLIFLGCDNVNDENSLKEIESNQNNLDNINVEKNKEKIIGNQLFLDILRTNKDGKDYLELYSDTKVIEFQKIEPNQFETLKNQTQYKDLYIDLPKKTLYRVDFKSDKSQLALTTIIDTQDEIVIKIYGIYLMGMG